MSSDAATSSAGGAAHLAIPPDDAGQPFRRSLPARVMGVGAALTVTVTAAVIGFSAGNGGSSDSVLTIGDATVPSTDVSRPRAGDNTTTTEEATTTTEGDETIDTTVASTSVPPTSATPVEPAPDPTPAPTNPANGDGGATRPPATPPPAGGDEDEDDNSDDEPQQVTVPDVFGMHRDEAVGELESLGLQARVRDGSDWGRHWHNLVQGQDPESGREVAPDEQVTIWIGTRR